MAWYTSINGNIVKKDEALISIYDRGFLYGYGLFETIRVYNGQPLFVKKHLDRLLNSAPQINIACTYNKEEITSMLFELINANALNNGSLRLTISAGESPENTTMVITARPGQPYEDCHYQEGFQTGLLKNRRNENSLFTFLKTLNFMENILGRQEAAYNGWNEGIFLNTAGNLCEGTVSNLFIVRENKLITPDVSSGLLPGITREKVIEMAHSAGIETEERPVQPKELKDAGEAFLTNSLMGIMPLVCFNNKNIGTGKLGNITKKLMCYVTRGRGY
ncbi:MAG: aminotransferase class IV [Clostridiales bacterium]|nr:aminotransferase class IV [Clostridiales bacterium]MCF8023220.1 aminotransferase class IV [Clostridiales bacterium]